jgi:tRNA pseudouridine55 synthase
MSAPEGILVIDKPVGPTSFDIVAKLRKSLQTREIGHCGTLDPLASGVVVVCVGRYCKLVRFLTADDKRYLAQITFGFSTPSLDLETEADEFGDVAVVTEDKLTAALSSWRGVIQQRPPIHSAIQQGGERLYDKARRGEHVEVAPRDVVVHGLKLVSWQAPHAIVELDVGKGFFVRSLARDLGEAVGCPAHLSSLRRTSSGLYSLDDAVPLDDARDQATAPGLLRTGPAAIKGMVQIDIDRAQATALKHGLRPATSLPNAFEVLACCEGEMAAVVSIVDGQLVTVRGM